MDHAPAAGAYRVIVVTHDGSENPVGTIRVRAGGGSYGTTVKVPVATIDSVRLTRPDAPSLTAVLKY